MRPLPPEILTAEYIGIDYFIPSPDIDQFVQKTFLNESSDLFNVDHLHLLPAHIGYLWTNVSNIKKQMIVAGTAETPVFRGSKWQKERQSVQMVEWFEAKPDFLITLDARLCDEMSDTQFCALLEHELYHCSHALDDFGSPKFNDAGRPIYAMRDHDISEFVGVVKRYGVKTVMNGQAFLDAAMQEPEFDGEDISRMCGSC